MSGQEVGVFTLIFVYGGFVASCFVWLHVGADKTQRTCISIPLYWLAVYLTASIMGWLSLLKPSPSPQNSLVPERSFLCSCW